VIDVPSSVEQHLTPRELGERLKVCPRTVAKLLRQGEATRGRAGIYPVRRVGRSVRIPESAVRSFLERCTHA